MTAPDPPITPPLRDRAADGAIRPENARRVAVWGTGNVGRPAIRAVAAHPALELTAVIVANGSKIGRDAGELAGIPPVGLPATSMDDADEVLTRVDAVVYTATADTRPVEALEDLVRCLRAGVNVVSSSFYALAHPGTVAPSLTRTVGEACAQGDSSVFVSGIDPGWVIDILPALVVGTMADHAGGVTSDVSEIRCQELFDYALYDQPDVVRNVIGFGRPLDEMPLMLHEGSLRFVWEPSLRNLADLLGIEVEAVTTNVARLALEEEVDLPGMGVFSAGTQGAFRFEVCIEPANPSHPRLVVEHVTRIHPTCAPDWPTPAAVGGEHRLVIKGQPELTISVHGHAPGEPGAAGGGNAVAANRLVSVIPAVCDAPAGILGPADLPPWSSRPGALR